MHNNLKEEWQVPFVIPTIVPTTEGGHLLVTSDEEKALSLLKSLEKVSIALLKKKGVIFHCKDGKKVTCCAAGKEFLKVVQNPMLELISSIFPECQLNPFVKIVIDAAAVDDVGAMISRLPIYEIDEKADKFVAMLNKMVDDIRTRMSSEAFKKTYKNYQRAATENKKEAFRLVDSVFRTYAKVLVVRLDLSYRKSASRPLDLQNISHKDVNQHLRSLLRTVRGKVFKDSLITYIWKLEYGPMKGYHYHTFFFFDGSKVKGDIALADMIGEHWNTVVTEGIGGYFNCNKIKDAYRRLAIGMIDHRDGPKIDYLKNKALDYLMKADYYVRPIASNRIRTFGKGAIKKRNATRSGRPRSELIFKPRFTPELLSEWSVGKFDYPLSK